MINEILFTKVCPNVVDIVYPAYHSKTVLTIIAYLVGNYAQFNYAQFEDMLNITVVLDIRTC